MREFEKFFSIIFSKRVDSCLEWEGWILKSIRNCKSFKNNTFFWTLIQISNEEKKIFEKKKISKEILFISHLSLTKATIYFSTILHFIIHILSNLSNHSYFPNLFFISDPTQQSNTKNKITEISLLSKHSNINFYFIPTLPTSSVSNTFFQFTNTTNVLQS